MPPPYKEHLASAANNGHPSAAAEEVDEPAQAQVGAGIQAHIEAAEITGLAAVGAAAVLDLVEQVQKGVDIFFHNIKIFAL